MKLMYRYQILRSKTFKILLLTLLIIAVFLYILLSRTDRLDPLDETDLTDRADPPNLSNFTDQVDLNKMYVLSNDAIFYNARHGIVTPQNNFAFIENVDLVEYMKHVAQYTSSDWEQMTYNLAERNRLENDYLILTVSNHAHLEFTLNWIVSLTINGYSKFLVVCLDINLYKSLLKHGYQNHSVLLPSKWLPKEFVMKPTEVNWNTKSYHLLTQARSFVTQKFLQKNFNVILNDVDLVWLSPNIVKYFEMIHKNTTLAYMRDFEADINTGFYLLRSTQIGIKMVEAVVKLQKTNHGAINDQALFNRAIHAQQLLGTQHLAALDYVLFATSRVGHDFDSIRQLGVSPLVFHANYVGGKVAKTAMLKAHNYWFIA